MLTRHVVLAILAFSALIFANIAVFCTLYFRNMSEKMVREHLVENLNEAQTRLGRALENQLGANLDECELSRLLAPQLRDMRQFHAVVLVDDRGTVVHRQWLVRENPNQRPSDAAAQILPLRTPKGMASSPQIAVEYSGETLEREVTRLRQDLQSKLRLALAISLALLLAAATYVIWVYRRGRKLQQEAQKADRLAYVGTLASGLAHEIRNPLNSMNMNIQLIEEEISEVGLGESEELREMFGATRREIQRLERLVSSFLSYARPTKPQSRPIQLNEVVLELQRFLKPELEQAGVSLVLTLEADLPLIPADEGQIRQALLNIVQNAVQVSERGQSVSITTRAAGGDKCVVEIRDRGPGIAPQELSQVFKVFYSTRRGGTGLGLPIAQRIAESHGGGIKLESQVGRGTCVTIILPRELS
jgi:signal transduction histidine kinase